MKKLLFLFSALFVTILHAQENNTENLGFNPPSIKWRKISVPTGKIIYPQGLDSIAQRMAGIMNYQRVNDKDIVGTGGTKKLPVIIQALPVFPEGFSTPAPWRNEHFIIPPQNLFYGPTPWTDFLTIHEYRHAQQFHMAKGGFTWMFKPLMGETGWLINSLFNQPLWFREGDAVSAETNLTKGGRGRLPRFNMEIKALLLSGYKYDYEKASYGISFKDFVPNPYRPGFYMTSKGRKNFGDDIWQKVLHDTYHKGLIYSFNAALKRNTGLSAKQLYNNTMSELDSFWRSNDAKLELITFKKITPTVQNNYINHRFPHFLPDGSLIYLKDALDDIRTFAILKDGKEEKIFPYGIYTEDHLMFATEGTKLTWAEAAAHPRWGNKTYSIIKIHDLKTGKTKKLTHRTRYFAPAPSHSGDRIAAVKIALDNKASLVIVNAADGKLLNEFPLPSNLFIAQPRWSDGDKDIIAIAISKEGNSIVSINSTSGSLQTILPATTIPINRPLPHGKYIYLSAGATGIDNIYALDRNTKELYQITSVRFGAYEPTVSADEKKLVYSNYTVNGYELAEIELNPSTWKKVQWPSEQLPSQPYIVSLKKEELTGKDFTQEYSSKKYSGLGDLFNISGWFPFIGVDQYGVQFLAQNIMNTLRGSITPFYNTNEKAIGVKADLTYAALYPMLHIGGGYQVKRPADIYENGTIYQQFWREKYLSGGISIPFILSGGNYRTRLNLRGDYEHFNIDFLDSLDASKEFRHLRFDAYHAQFSLSHLAQRARRQVQPRWGQTVNAEYRKAIEETPEQFTVQSRFYFPGFLKTHSFNVGFATKKEEVVNTYRFSGNTIMPRGYDPEPFENIYVAGANYELPVWYPDLSLGGVAFVQRLRTNFFYDHSEAKRLNNQYKLNSVGGELFIDLRALRLFGMTMGIRYSHILNKNVIATTPFQFFISRFELVN